MFFLFCRFTQYGPGGTTSCVATLGPGGYDVASSGTDESSGGIGATAGIVRSGVVLLIWFLVFHGVRVSCWSGNRSRSQIWYQQLEATFSTQTSVCSPCQGTPQLD